MTEPTKPVTRPLSELRSTGALWLINRVVFHPRGFAIALVIDKNDDVRGWQLQGDGCEPWSFDPADEDDLFALVQALLTPVPREDTTT